MLGRAHSARTYKAVIDLIIQSAVGYSLALLIWGIAWASLVSGEMHHYIEQICFISAVCPCALVFFLNVDLSNADLYSGAGADGHGRTDYPRIVSGSGPPNNHTAHF